MPKPRVQIHPYGRDFYLVQSRSSKDDFYLVDLEPNEYNPTGPACDCADARKRLNPRCFHIIEAQRRTTPEHP